MDLVEVPLEKWKKNDSREDKIYNLLGFQMGEIDKAFCDSGLEIIDASIQGEQLEEPNIVKFQINSKEVELSNPKKKKDSKPIKLRTVMPNLPNFEDKVSKLANEELSKVFNDLMRAISNKKIMFEILEIELTEENNELYRAFYKQYWGLWLSLGDQRKALFNKLFERIDVVLDKYSEQETDGN